MKVQTLATTQAAINSALQGLGLTDTKKAVQPVTLSYVSVHEYIKGATALEQKCWEHHKRNNKTPARLIKAEFVTRTGTDAMYSGTNPIYKTSWLRANLVPILFARYGGEL